MRSLRSGGGGGKLLSGSILASISILAQVNSSANNVAEPLITQILIWIFIVIGILLILWGLFERVDIH